MKRRIAKGQRVEEFFAVHQLALARQGAVVASWRWRAGQRTGPYWRLECRDPAGTKHAVYLGREGPLVQTVRSRLTCIRRPLRERRKFEYIQRRLRRGLRAARAKLSEELAMIGLRLQGSEIRGTGRGTPSQVLGAHLGIDSLHSKKLENQKSGDQQPAPANP